MLQGILHHMSSYYVTDTTLVSKTKTTKTLIIKQNKNKIYAFNFLTKQFFSSYFICI